MRATRLIYAAAMVLAATATTQAGAEEPCVELELRGKEVFEIPCPEGLDRILESLPLWPGDQAKPGFAIPPEYEEDRNMEVDPGWPPEQEAPAGPETI